ncbi:hypothetical protein H5410_051211, partial [Solanum commersonii]
MAESNRLTRDGRETIRTFTAPNRCAKPSSNFVESSSTHGELEKDDEDQIVDEAVFKYFCMFTIFGTAFACKNLSKNASYIHCYVNHEIKTQLTDHLSEQQYSCEKTCFGHFMRIRNCVAQGQIHRCCMALELECRTRQALVIRVNGTILKFTLRTFALITGLNCVGVLGDFKFNTEEPTMLIVQYFGSKDFNRRSDLIDRFNNKVWADNEDDTLKFAILYFIHTYVYSGEKTTKRIPRIHFNLVESGRYMQYPWGRKAFHWFLKSINKKMTSHGQFYRICDMHIVLQMWIYECSGKDNVNDEDDGQRPPPFTSPDLSGKQHQGVSVNSHVRNLISIDDVVSESRTVVPRHDQDRYKKKKVDIPMPMNFGVALVDHKNWFYMLFSIGQLLNDLHITIIFYYLQKKAKYEAASRYKYTIVDCVFTSKISSIWGKYGDLDSDICCVDEEHIIGEYIRGYKVHVGILWHLVDHIFVLVHVNDKFHWILIVVSLNDKHINLYDSYRAAGHNAAIKIEVKKLAQLIPLKLTMNDYYKNRGLDISTSQEENEFFEIVFIESIPQQEYGSLDCSIYMISYAEWLPYGQGNPTGKFDAMFL